MTFLSQIIDSESILHIPEEYVDTGLEMALLFLPSESIQLDVWVIQAVGSFYLALEDQKYRTLFADFAQVGLGGFLASLVPNKS